MKRLIGGLQPAAALCFQHLKKLTVRCLALALKAAVRGLKALAKLLAALALPVLLCALVAALQKLLGL
jgi:hypothetical protein